MGQAAIAARFISPATLFLAVLLFVLSVQGVGVYALTQQPWTGIRAYSNNTDTLDIASITANSPAAGKLAVGDGLLGLQTEQGMLKLTPLLNGYPPLSPATFAEQDRFYQWQESLHKAFTYGTGLNILTTSGKTVNIQPKPYTPITAIPWIFWLLCLSNLISPLVGMLVWTYRPQQLASLFLLLHSLLYYVFAVGGAVVIASEFHLDPVTLRYDLLAQIIGINFAAVLILVLLCYVPKPLVRGLWLFWLIMGVTALSTASYQFRWVESPVHIFYMQYPILYLIALVVIALQIRNTRHQPVERASLLVMSVAFMLPNAIIIALHVIPILRGLPPIAGNITALLLFNLMAIGLAVGILRYRLFDIEFWWIKSMLWILGGIMVAGIDIGLTSLLHTPDRYALGISVIIAGFLYFPLRQWLLGKFIPLEQQGLQEFLPAFSTRMADATSKESFEQRWEEALRQRYSPIHLETLPQQLAAPTLSESGLHLLVPSLGNQHAYRLSGKQRAARLFNNSDVKNTASLLAIARMAANASEMRQQAILGERRRIMSDLHDSVGAKLLTLTHKLPDPEHKAAAKDALTTLRDTIRLSTRTTPLKLEEHIADWRAEVAERTETAGIAMEWRQQGDMGQYQLTPRQVLELTQILREAVSNAIRHASPSKLLILFDIQLGELRIDLINDGEITPPDTWQPGTGIRTIRERSAKLGGKASFIAKHQPFAHVRVTLRIPLGQENRQ